MRSTRWSTTILLSLAGLIVLLATAAQAVRLSLPDVTAAPGERVRIPVQVDATAAEEILSGRFDIRFDSRILLVDSLRVDQRGTVTASWFGATNRRMVPDSPAAEGQVLTALATASDRIPGPGILIYLDVLVAPNAPVGSVTPLRWGSVFLNNGAPSASTQDGSLQVTGAHVQADFRAAPQQGTVPLEVQFEDLSSGDVASWAWAFGDGETSAEGGPRHRYATPGDYTVSLTVSGAAGSDTETKQGYIRVVPDQVPPAIVEGPAALGVTHNAATVFWKTDELGTSQVQWCALRLKPVWATLHEIVGELAGELGESESEVLRRLLHGELPGFDAGQRPRYPLFGTFGQASDTTLVLEHWVPLSRLTSFTFYLYRVRSADAYGNYSPWKGGFFATLARPDERAPQIVLGPQVTPAVHRALITWTTDEPGDSFVQFALNDRFEGAQRVSNAELVRQHAVWLEDLAPNTTFYYRVRSTDASANTSAFKVGSFRTLTSDSQPPVLLSGPTLHLRTPYKALVEWETDEPSTSRVEFGTSTEYERFVQDAGLEQHHEVLLTHLDPKTVYHFRVVSADAGGNAVSSGDATFSTRGREDTHPPGILKQPYVLKRYQDRVSVGWLLDEEGTCRLEYGATATYGQVVEVAQPRRAHEVTLAGLAPGTTYHGRLYVFDLDGNGPSTSPDFTFWTASAADAAAPLILAGPLVRDREDHRITVVWTTDEMCDSWVEYGATSAYDRRAGSADAVLNHVVTLTNLEPGASYHLRVSSTDAVGNGPVRSQDLTVTTRPEPDQTPPLILSGPVVVARSEASAAIEWETDEPADSFVDYGLSISYGEERTDGTFVRRHRLYLTNLSPGTTYHARVSSTDPAGNGPATSADFTVTTKAAGDRQPPRIRGLNLCKVTDATALLEWETDEPASGFVDHGATTAYTERVGVPEFLQKHQARLTGLKPGTTYHFQVLCTDQDGNAARSEDRTFRTESQADDRPPLVVRGPEIVATHATATFIWRTDEPCLASVVVGTSQTLGTPAEQSFEEEKAAEEHRITVTGLQRNQRYFFALVSRDLSGNETVLGQRRGAAAKVVRPAEDAGQFSFLTDPVEDQAPPVIVVGPALLSQADTEVLIGWTTDEIGDSQVLLVDGGIEVLIAHQPDHEFEHRVRLGGLQPGTPYLVRVASRDPVGNGPIRSQVFAFSTLATPDQTPPQFVSGPEVMALGDRRAVLVWQTDEASSAEVLFGQAALGTSLTEPDLATRHEVELTNLAPGTTYQFQVRLYDAQQNGPVASTVRTFATAALPDQQAPRIVAGPLVQQVADRSAVITWTTDEAADGFVQFGTGTEMDQAMGRAVLERVHRVELTNLTPATTYRFAVNSADPAGNGPVQSQPLALSTLSQPDRVPPQPPSGLVVRAAGDGEALVSWRGITAADLAGYNLYRRTESGAFALLAGPVQDTSYRDQTGKPGETYYYRITAVDRTVPANESPASAEVQFLSRRNRGDFQGDGRVGFEDFFLMVERFGSRRGAAEFQTTYDLDDDGQIGLQDFFLFVDLFGTRYQAARPLATEASGPVFEPALIASPVAASGGEYVVAVRTRPAEGIQGYGLGFAYEADRARFVRAEVRNTEFAAAAGKPPFLGVLEDRPGVLVVGARLPTGTVFEGDGTLVELVFAAVPGSAPAVLRVRQVASLDKVGQVGQRLLGSDEVSVTLVPVTWALEQNYPNPFNPRTAIRFQMPEPGRVSLRVYDLAGQVVAQLVDAELPAGHHQVTWDGQDRSGRPVASGAYLYLLEAGAHRQVHKLMLLR
jgi:PKD repeat protein